MSKRRLLITAKAVRVPTGGPHRVRVTQGEAVELDDRDPAQAAAIVDLLGMGSAVEQELPVDEQRSQRRKLSDHRSDDEGGDGDVS